MVICGITFLLPGLHEKSPLISPDLGPYEEHVRNARVFDFHSSLPFGAFSD